MKRFLSIILTLSLLFSFAVPINAAGHVEITVFHVNDVHSRVAEYNNFGFAKIATVVNEARTAGDHVLLLDAGDSFHGQTFATISKGASIARLMNLMKFDALTTGNHDFNYGQARLLELQAETNFPLLAANVIKADNSMLLDDYVIKEFEGVKVAIFGLATPETTYKTHPDNVEGLTFEDPTVTAQRMVDLLTPMADIIVCLGHIGNQGMYTSEAIATAVDGIDLFVDAHSHSIYGEGSGMVVNDTLIVQTSDYAKNLGKVTLSYMDGTVTSSATLLTTEDAASIVPNPDVLALMETVNAENEVITSAVVGTTTIDLQGERSFVRTGETNLGNLIAEAMLDASGADLAITNGGGIRASIPTGDITQGDIISVLPFGNYVITKSVMGSDIRSILEVGISDYPTEKGAFPHIAGMTIKFDSNLPVGSKLTEVMIGDELLDDTKTYVLATNDFLGAGGDEYTALANYPILGEFAALDEVLVSYMKENGTEKATVTGRIAAVEPVVVEEPVVVPPVVVPPVVTPPVVEAPVVYIVKSGDVLWRIAKAYGFTWQELSEFNQLKNPHLIYPGNKILIPSN
ncbi:Multifunctional 2',3'-cyclic-nucleotide 2'-phosphodiesterase/5'-nucleotidase/3'-nucleotidase [Petrocella atlantisensis]|uniref:Multifunctional 2',3'-cyclic-nucleotide 2'-phosphodiesterase/5'-nucleotidase/3'-nucleotidase n=1 Tax=Petrocella atlantisensis TaxID=2173034 RepID=A0A3P7P3V2_9FIRM|nr:5'-nucleotidase C-terminal domain-containing protein [Petrocella atlantisensis]VDN48230.1 Multifunctional 2',3'-cyclic-nucleotide 2'-phosphodiesterase/5'-nucleotidase/3'-nucleotidase [Petrocella atlantisensis]